MDDDKWEVTSPQFNEGIQHLAVAPKNSQKHQDWLWYRYTSFLATGKFPWKLHLEPDTTAVPTNPPTRTRCGTHTWTLDVNGVGLLHFDDLVTTGAAFLGSPKQTPKEKKKRGYRTFGTTPDSWLVIIVIWKYSGEFFTTTFCWCVFPCVFFSQKPRSQGCLERMMNFLAGISTRFPHHTNGSMHNLESHKMSKQSKQSKLTNKQTKNRPAQLHYVSFYHFH